MTTPFKTDHGPKSATFLFESSILWSLHGSKISIGRFMVSCMIQTKASSCGSNIGIRTKRKRNSLKPRAPTSWHPSIQTCRDTHMCISHLCHPMVLFLLNTSMGHSTMPPGLDLTSQNTLRLRHTTVAPLHLIITVVIGITLRWQIPIREASGMLLVNLHILHKEPMSHLTMLHSTVKGINMSATGHLTELIVAVASAVNIRQITTCPTQATMSNQWLVDPVQ